MFEYFALTTRIISHSLEMNHKLLSPALGYHKQTEIVLFNLFNDYKKTFPSYSCT